MVEAMYKGVKKEWSRMFYHEKGGVSISIFFL